MIQRDQDEGAQQHRVQRVGQEDQHRDFPGSDQTQDGNHEPDGERDQGDGRHALMLEGDDAGMRRAQAFDFMEGCFEAHW